METQFPFYLKNVISNTLSTVDDSLFARISDLSREPACAVHLLHPHMHLSLVQQTQRYVWPVVPPGHQNPRITSLIVPKDENVKFATSRETRDALQRALKSSDFNLKIKSIFSARNGGVRIEVHSVDLPKVKKCQEFDKAGLKLIQENKTFRKLLIHGVPCSMSKEDLKAEIIALYLRQINTSDVKIIYIFPSKENRKYTNCVLELKRLGSEMSIYKSSLG